MTAGWYGWQRQQQGELYLSLHWLHCENINMEEHSSSDCKHHELLLIRVHLGVRLTRRDVTRHQVGQIQLFFNFIHNLLTNYTQNTHGECSYAYSH